MNVIYETDLYQVEVGECVLEGPWKGLDAYLIRNKRTNVLEGEISIEAAARKMCNQLTEELQANLDNPEEGYDEDEAFQKFLNGLSDDPESNPV